VPPLRNKYQRPSPAEAPTTVVNSVEPSGPPGTSAATLDRGLTEYFGISQYPSA